MNAIERDLLAQLTIHNNLKFQKTGEGKDGRTYVLTDVETAIKVAMGMSDGLKSEIAFYQKELKELKSLYSRPASHKRFVVTILFSKQQIDGGSINTMKSVFVEAEDKHFAFIEAYRLILKETEVQNEGMAMLSHTIISLDN